MKTTLEHAGLKVSDSPVTLPGEMSNEVGEEPIETKVYAMFHGLAYGGNWGIAQNVYKGDIVEVNLQTDPGSKIALDLAKSSESRSNWHPIDASVIPSLSFCAECNTFRSKEFAENHRQRHHSAPQMPEPKVYERVAEGLTEEDAAKWERFYGKPYPGSIIPAGIQTNTILSSGHPPVSSSRAGWGK